METIKPIFKTPQIHTKGWGREVWIDNNNEYCGKLLEFKKGSRFSMHFHIKKRETFFVLKGKLLFIYKDLTNGDSMTEGIKEYDVIEIPRNCPHQLYAIEDSTIIEVSTPHEESDSYRIVPGDSQKSK